MFDLFFDLFMLTVLFYVLAVMFFTLDALILKGIFANKLRSWVSKKLE